MRRRAIATVVVAALVVLATAPVNAGHNATQIHTTDTDFNAGTFDGNVTVDGTGDGATLTFGTTDTTTVDFSHTGSQQTFTVPTGVDSLNVRLEGAGGGDGAADYSTCTDCSTETETGQSGGLVDANVSVTPGDTVYIYVGGNGSDASTASTTSGTAGTGGFNGGGDGGVVSESANAGSGVAASGGGGGATDIRVGGTSLSDRILVAAGGAGGGAAAVVAPDASDIKVGTSGQGGANTGEDGQTVDTGSSPSASGGSGGDQTSEGATGATGNTESQVNSANEAEVGASGGGGGGFDYGRAGQVKVDDAPQEAGVGGSGGGSNYIDSNVATNTISNARGSGSSTNGVANITYVVKQSTYVSANYSVEDAQSGFVNVTENTDANLTVLWEGWTGSSWTTLNKTTSVTTTGNVTYPFSSASVTKVRVNLTTRSVSGADSSTLQVADEGLTFQTHDPTVDNASADPQGGTLIQSSPETLSIDVNDTDFAKSHGDSVDVQFFVNESGDDAPRSIGTDTLTSNGTASISYSPQTGGNVTWFVWANDSYNHTQQSDTFNLTTPSSLSVYSEINGSKLLTNANITLKFYINESQLNATVVTRNTSDGTINMAGLPVDEPFVVTAEANGFRDRRVFIKNLFSQQRIYLLNNSVASVETIFTLEDYTGRFPDDSTVLIVQNAINGSYETVLGDFFGATGQFTAKMQEGERHRLLLYNVNTGKRLIEGTYTPITASTQTITVTPGEIERISNLSARAFISPTGDRLPPQDNVTLSAIVETDQSVSWSVTATLTNNSGTFTVWSNSSSRAGQLTRSLNLTGDGGATINVTVQYTINGKTKSKSMTYNVGNAFPNQTSLLQGLANLATLSPPGARGVFTTFLSMVLIGLSMGAMGTLGMRGEVIGLGGLFALTGFAVVGWVSYGMVFASGVGLLAFAAIRRGL